MKRIIITSIILLSLGCAFKASAQTEQDNKYRRSSLYSVLINHTEQKFSDDIRKAFLQMPIPDKYNDHDLSVKVLEMDKTLRGAKSENENMVITKFLNDNKVASRLVGKWFNRDIYTGTCDMELVKERGLYNASEYDRILAEKSARSNALLMDAGEDLIGNTFVLVNDIRYIDKEKRGVIAGQGLRAVGSLLNAFTGISLLEDVADMVSGMVETLKGFKVKINTFLYQLEWDEATATTFYKDQYAARPDSVKKKNFEAGRGGYKLKYVGKVESSGSTTSFMGVKLDKPEAMVRKACQRAIDENIASLQSEFEEFRTKSPIVTTEPITAFVGLKEGVSEKSRFEVLEMVENEDGSREYNRVAIITPMNSMIWDNRYMAAEEGSPKASLGRTTFKKESGGEIMAGMLIREIK
ncbi:MAG: hypothetical protein J6C15_06950 [Bacteroidaceae bacterium]|nr:hypothetical protein [Bacteroidaceae bacterium]